MTLILLAALLLDECFGELKRFHPLIIFGNYALFLERLLYTDNIRWQFMAGVCCWALAVLLVVALSVFIMWLIYSLCPSWVFYVVNIIVLYLTIGQKSLKQHAKAVSDPLAQVDDADNLNKARQALSMIVSRDTQQANPQHMATSTIETVTENTHDAVIGPMVFFIIAGAPAAILFRLSNTLDAMWGYRTERYELFGKCSARMDDALGFIPARITSLLMAFSSPKYFIQTLKSIWITGRNWYSPNAGLVMAAGAGALNIRLGGDAVYNGIKKARLTLGLSQGATAAKVEDINRSIKLMYKTSVLLILFIAVLEYVMGYSIISALSRVLDV
jgi:adenosylcobinamide-phosphate synthase